MEKRENKGGKWIMQSKKWEWNKGKEGKRERVKEEKRENEKDSKSEKNRRIHDRKFG